MYREKVLRIYYKSFDIPDSADEILQIVIATRKSRIGLTLALLLTYPVKAALTTAGIALWFISIILSAGQAPLWSRKNITDELKNTIKSVHDLHPATPTYTGLKNATTPRP